MSALLTVLGFFKAKKNVRSKTVMSGVQIMKFGGTIPICGKIGAKWFQKERLGWSQYEDVRPHPPFPFFA